MIAANGVTARFLEEKGFPSLRRVLRSPERWDRIVAAGRGDTGESCRRSRRAVALEAFLTQAPPGRPGARSPTSRSPWSSCWARASTWSSCPAAATPEHFGLAVRDYTHSTAPNRRFPDLVTQRLLKAALAGQPRPLRQRASSSALARHCTEQEDNAAKVERQVRKSAAAMLLASRDRRAVRRHRHRRLGQGNLGAHLPARRSRASSMRGSRGSTSATACGWSSSHTDVERGFIDFVRSRDRAPRPAGDRASPRRRGQRTRRWGRGCPRGRRRS